MKVINPEMERAQETIVKQDTLRPNTTTFMLIFGLLHSVMETLAKQNGPFVEVPSTATKEQGADFLASLRGTKNQTTEEVKELRDEVENLLEEGFFIAKESTKSINWTNLLQVMNEGLKEHFQPVGHSMNPNNRDYVLEILQNQAKEFVEKEELDMESVGESYLSKVQGRLGKLTKLMEPLSQARIYPFPDKNEEGHSRAIMREVKANNSSVISLNTVFSHSLYGKLSLIERVFNADCSQEPSNPSQDVATA